jgi:5-methylthioadenosine/S-adenosylhomocysteine deaminase
MLRTSGLLILLVFADCIFAQERPIALIGNIITSDRSITNGTLLIVNQHIAAAGPRVPIPKNAIVLHTGGIILPGLIDLHNHLLWNVLPRWNPIETFRNRYEWLDGSLFRTRLVSPYRALIDAGLSCAMQQYAEVKAITQGSTTVIGGLREPCNRGLARNLDDDLTLGKILYNVSPLQMTEAEAREAKDTVYSNGSFLIHLSEGSSNDAASRREFSMLKSHGLLIPGVSLIHGVALQRNDFD